MSKLNALRCLLGLHEWSRWRKCGSALVGGFAVQQRYCQRCGEVQRRPWQGRARKPAKEAADVR